MELKNTWKQINLGKSATLKARIGWQGLTTAEYLSSGDYFLVTGTDFLNGFIDWNNCVHVEKERYDQDKYIQLKVDDILVTKDGTIGKVAIVDRIVKPTTLNSGVFVVRPFGKSFYPKYLYYILRSGHFADFLSKLTAGSTINHLYQKDFVHYTFPAPPTLVEQRLIAETLSDTDILIQNLKTLILKKKAIKIGAMQELLSGKKRLEGFKGEWKKTKVSNISTIKGRVGWKGYTKKDLVDNGPYAIGAKHINKSNKLDLSDPTCLSYEKFIESPEIMVFKNDVLIVQRGTIGKVVLIETEIGDATINPSMLILRSTNIPPKFIYYYLTSEEGQNQIIIDTSSTGVPMITQKQVLNFRIPLPPTIAEQKAIAQILSDMDTEIEALEAQLQKTQNLIQGMMQELLTGKIRLVEPVS